MGRRAKQNVEEEKKAREKSEDQKKE